MDKDTSAGDFLGTARTLDEAQVALLRDALGEQWERLECQWLVEGVDEIFPCEPRAFCRNEPLNIALILPEPVEAVVATTAEPMVSTSECLLMVWPDGEARLLRDDQARSYAELTRWLSQFDAYDFQKLVAYCGVDDGVGVEVLFELGDGHWIESVLIHDLSELEFVFEGSGVKTSGGGVGVVLTVDAHRRVTIREVSEIDERAATALAKCVAVEGSSELPGSATLRTSDAVAGRERLLRLIDWARAFVGDDGRLMYVRRGLLRGKTGANRHLLRGASKVFDRPRTSMVREAWMWLVHECDTFEARRERGLLEPVTPLDEGFDVERPCSDPSAMVEMLSVEYRVLMQRLLMQFPVNKARQRQWESEKARVDEVFFVEVPNPRSMPNRLPPVSLAEFVESSDGETRVDTCRVGDARDVGMRKWETYHLRPQGRGFQIQDVVEHLHPRDALFLSEAQYEAASKPGVGEAFAPPFESDDPSGAFALFEPGPIENNWEVHKLGRLKVTSGILVAMDFGHSATELSPLVQRVSPGQYPASIATAHGNVLSMSVRFSSSTPSTFVLAKRVDGRDFVGVDAANVAFFDLDAVADIGAREMEAVYQYVIQRMSMGTMATIDGDEQVAICSSNGDGRYPVYWGFDDAGQPAVLLVDFQ